MSAAGYAAPSSGEAAVVVHMAVQAGFEAEGLSFVSVVVV